MFRTLPNDLDAIRNKYHIVGKPFNAFSRMAYHGWPCDPSTGMDDAEMDKALAALAAELQGQPHPIMKARMLAFVLDNARIDVGEHDYFVCLYNWNRPISKYTVHTWAGEENRKYPEAEAMLSSLGSGGALSAWLDFDHTVPDWDSLMTLGFPGILARAHACYQQLCEAGGATRKQTDFYQGIVIAYEAIIRFVDRLYRLAQTRTFPKAERIARCLCHLRDGAPTDTYEALQLIYLYFMISESIDHYQVRSLGYGLDSTLWPFYQADLESGRYTEADLAELLGYFLMQWSAIGNYWGQPFYLGGRDALGNTRVNELSRLILRVYDALNIFNPKIQIKVHPSTPRDFLLQALDMIRRGHNSIVFCNDETIARYLMSLGYSWEDAAENVISGCYEYKTKKSGVGISCTYFNMLTPVLWAMENGCDARTGKQLGVPTGVAEEFADFAAFYQAYLTQLHHLVQTGLEAIQTKEQTVQNINPSLLFSGSVPACMEKMTDALDSGVDNTTAVLLNGLGSAVDALMAVRELVYERKLTTMQELRDALKSNWQGYEKLRLQALRLPPKYGTGHEMADHYAAAIVQQYYAWFAHKRNPHGGQIVTELHSARKFIEDGARTMASPDGRRAGEELSKNASPTMGMDTKGITALIRSATTIDTALCTNGFNLDAMLHPSAVSGEDGLAAFYAVLQTYMEKGGASIHFNIVDTATLRDAQEHPEKYGDLQIRVCGWNALWNDLPRTEQDAYIRRSEQI